MVYNYIKYLTLTLPALSFAVLASAQNTPPQLTANVGLSLQQNEEKTITTTMLNATDLDAFGEPSHPGDIRFVVGIVPLQDEVVRFGELVLVGVQRRVLVPGDEVRLLEIQDGALRYRAFVADSFGDGFNFKILDAEGLDSAGDPDAYFRFSIQIIPVNTPPVAGSGSAEIGIGAVYEGTLPAVDNDLPANQLTYSIITPAPTKGTVEILDASSGSFRYTATPGQTGADTITFQVADSEFQSAQPGTFTITMVNQPPVVEGATYVLTGGHVLEGKLQTSDPDLPAQPLQFTVTRAPERGSLFFRPGGAFQYVPDPGRFGEDNFTVVINDGTADSEPADVRIDIITTPVPGDLLISTQTPGQGGTDSLLILIDPDQLDLREITRNGRFLIPRAVVHSSWTGKVYGIVDEEGMSVILEIDPLTGEQRVVLSGAPLVVPMGLAASSDGFLYVGGPRLPQVGNEGELLRIDLRDDSVEEIEVENLDSPTGLAFGPDGDLYILDVADLGAGNPDATADAAVYRLNIASGNATVVTQGNELKDPLALVVLGDGSMVISEIHGHILHVTPDGTQNVIYEADTSPAPGITGITVDENDNIYFVTGGITGGEVAIKRITSLDPVTVETFLAGDFIGNPFGLAVITEHASYDAWLAGYFTAADRANSALEATLWGDDADPDNDSLTNLMEFALTRSPLQSDDALQLIRSFVRTDDTGDYLRIHFNRRSETNGLLCELQVSDGLGTWTTITGTKLTTPHGTTAVFEDDTAIGSQPNRFIRLKISRQE